MPASMTGSLLENFSATKACARCGVPYPRVEFMRGSCKSKYLQSYCRPCHADLSRSRKGSPIKYATWRVWKQRRGSVDALALAAMRGRGAAHLGNGTTERMATDLHRYGMDANDYFALLESQGGACAICRKLPKKTRRLCVDHCHSTGHVRGLLCDRCNGALGSFGDSVEVLMTAIRYLERA